MDRQQVMLAAVLEQAAGPRAMHRRVEAAADGQAARHHHRFQIDADIVAVGRAELQPADMARDEIMDESHLLPRRNILRPQPHHRERGCCHGALLAMQMRPAPSSGSFRR